MGADPNFFNKTLPATLGLMGIFSYTGFGDFLGDFGNRNKKMTAGRAGKGFGQFAGGLLSALLMISGSKDKNPLGLIAGLATLVGTRKLFADTPRGRSTNPFSFSDTQKYNKGMFASGGAIPSFADGENVFSTTAFGGLYGALGLGLLASLTGNQQNVGRGALLGALLGGLGGYGSATGVDLKGLNVSGDGAAALFLAGMIPGYAAKKTTDFLFGSGGSIPSFNAGDTLKLSLIHI